MVIRSQEHVSHEEAHGMYIRRASGHDADRRTPEAELVATAGVATNSPTIRTWALILIESMQKNRYFW